MANNVTPTYTYSDINGLFTANPFSGDIVLSYDTAAINNSINNLIFCKNYERPFFDYLNCGIEQDLFEPVNPVTADTIKTKITNVLSSYEPRIENVAVNVAVTAQGNGYTVTIYYLPKTTLQPQTLNIFLARVI